MIEMGARQINVAMCVAAGDQVQTFWAHDWARMMAWTASTRPDVGLTQLFCTGSLIPKQRNTLLRAVIEDGGFTHAFWVDTDMRYPKDTLLRLLAYEAPAVCVNYTRRNAPYLPVAMDTSKDMEPLYTTAESTGLEQVGACGFGVVLLRLADLKDLKEPYFMVGFNRDTKMYLGEDVYFCIKLSEIGLPLMVDHDLSKECAHIGKLELTCEHALRQRAVEEVKTIEVVDA